LKKLARHRIVVLRALLMSIRGGKESVRDAMKNATAMPTM
jgi:hypothetical protein